MPRSPEQPEPRDACSATRWRSRALTGLIVAIGFACFVAGGAALWLWFDPARLAQATPWRLLGLLGLFVLPAATIVFQSLDRRSTRRRAGIDDADDHPARASSSTPAPAVRRHASAQRTRPAVAQRRPRSFQ